MNLHSKIVILIVSEVGMEVEPFDEGGGSIVNGEEEKEEDQTADSEEPDSS